MRLTRGSMIADERPDVNSAEASGLTYSALRSEFSIPRSS